MEKSNAGKSGSQEWDGLQFKTGGPEKALLRYLRKISKEGGCQPCRLGGEGWGQS